MLLIKVILERRRMQEPIAMQQLLAVEQRKQSRDIAQETAVDLRPLSVGHLKGQFTVNTLFVTQVCS